MYFHDLEFTVNIQIKIFTNKTYFPLPVNYVKVKLLLCKEPAVNFKQFCTDKKRGSYEQ